MSQTSVWSALRSLVADEAAADRADDGRHRLARAAADQAAEAAADQRAADGAGGVGHVLHRSCVIDSTVPTRAAGCSLTWKAGGVLQAPSASTALAANAAVHCRHADQLAGHRMIRPGRMLSFGNRVEQVHRGEQARRTAELAQPLREDRARSRRPCTPASAPCSLRAATRSRCAAARSAYGSNERSSASSASFAGSLACAARPTSLILSPA